MSWLLIHIKGLLNKCRIQAARNVWSLFLTALCLTRLKGFLRNSMNKIHRSELAEMCSEGILYSEGEGDSRKQKCVLKAYFTMKEKAAQGNRNVF